MDGRVRKPRLEPGTLLRVSEHFLRRRHFDDCRKYLHQAYEIDPNFPGVSEILAVADVLLASKRRFSTEALPDWYAIMQLNRFSKDSDIIRQRFNHLYGILDPNSNKFPFANEAFDLVCNAWYVLSNPLKRLEYDELLMKHLDGEKFTKNSDFAFWTVCPYCYYLYEYPRVYFELCLRCPNEKCSKAFTCVEIDRPPVEVLMEGKYVCSGFLPVGSQYGGWNPFAVSKKQKVNDTNDACNFVEIPDDDDDEIEVKSGKPSSFNGEGVHAGSGNAKMDGDCSTMKLDVRRKKSVAKKSTKVTAAGNRVTKDGFVQWEQPDVIVPSTFDEDAVCENDFSCEMMEPMNAGEVEFYDGDDDILVSLQNGI